MQAYAAFRSAFYHACSELRGTQHLHAVESERQRRQRRHDPTKSVEHEELLAATQIQAAARGRMVRREAKGGEASATADEHNQQPEATAHDHGHLTKPDAVAIGHFVHEAKEAYRTADEVPEEHSLDAVGGYLGLQGSFYLTKDGKHEELLAATQIQAAARGRLARKMVASSPSVAAGAADSVADCRDEVPDSGAGTEDEQIAAATRLRTAQRG
eukprot:SAG31_NODE_12549_length_933_cov_1.268585_1_plen_213_part_01